MRLKLTAVDRGKKSHPAARDLILDERGTRWFLQCINDPEWRDMELEGVYIDHLQRNEPYSYARDVTFCEDGKWVYLRVRSDVWMFETDRFNAQQIAAVGI